MRRENLLRGKYITVNMNSLNEKINSKAIFNQKDVETAVILCKLEMENTVDLTDCDVRVEILKPDDTKVVKECEIVDKQNGLVVIDLSSQCLAAIGEVVCELVIQYETQVLYSPRITYTVVDNLFDEVDYVSVDEYPILNQLIEKVREVEKELDTLETKVEENETTRIENEAQRIKNETTRVEEFKNIKNEYETYKRVMIDESNVAALQHNINQKIDDVLISDNVLTFLANSKTIKTIKLPKSNISEGGVANGKEIELRNNGTHIQWKYTNDGEWINLVELSSLQGATGPQGIQGERGLQGPVGP
ncbi:BppU family phage baseplate upper protein, partial [Terrisporobacter sp.]|uniref:BppU family phage baseplate upper protein n=1 Tax=Terrisporobacter sp. TaxID=1965305 RepID=UPI0039922807